MNIFQLKSKVCLRCWRELTIGTAFAKDSSVPPGAHCAVSCNSRDSILTVSILLIQKEVCILRWHGGPLYVGLAYTLPAR